MPYMGSILLSHDDLQPQYCECRPASTAECRFGSPQTWPEQHSGLGPSHKTTGMVGQE